MARVRASPPSRRSPIDRCQNAERAPINKPVGDKIRGPARIGARLLILPHALSSNNLIYAYSYLQILLDLKLDGQAA
jgi:hypothetical protein